MVRVAVIDSGVNTRHPHILHVAGGVAIGDSDPQAYLDVLGHGTAVMAAIQEKAPDAKYYAVKLFHTSLRTSIAHLVEALEWAIDARMDIVNLSLGTRNPEHAARFAPLIERASAQGTILVSALDADGETCFPGSMSGVLGVGLDWDCDRDAYYAVESPAGCAFRTSGYPRSLPGVPQERNLSGISFAVANMCGFVARACEAVTERSLTNVREELILNAARFTCPVAR